MIVLAEVASALENSAGEVRALLVQTLTTREKSRRVDLLDKALVKRDQLQKEIYKLNGAKPGKAPLKQLGADGTVTEIPAVYTPEEFKKYEAELKDYNKKVKEATERVDKFDSVLEECFIVPTNKSFDKLAAMVNSKGEPSKPEASDDNASA